eukprot:g426.t1
MAWPLEDSIENHFGRRLKQATNTPESSSSSENCTGVVTDDAPSTSDSSANCFIYEDDETEAVPICRERENADGSTQTVCSTVVRNIQFRCAIERKESASNADGLIRDPVNTRGLRACCDECRREPRPQCRSWWRQRGNGQPCYLDRNL